jgi:hypothetical protein
MGTEAKTTRFVSTILRYLALLHALLANKGTASSVHSKRRKNKREKR